MAARRTALGRGLGALIPDAAPTTGSAPAPAASAPEAEIPVDRWLEGARTADIVVKTPSAVTKVEIDAGQWFPDANRDNNVWERK